MTEKMVIHNIIGGEIQAASDGQMMDIVNPSTGEVYASAPNSSAVDVDQACKAAGKAFEKWRWSTPSERQLALLKLADVIEENADELVAIESENTGKPTSLTKSEEIRPMVDQIRFFAGAARVLEGRSQGEYMRGHTSSIRREPVGVVGQVAPWNYPMMMAIWKIAPALAAGCTVVLKPSDTTPASAYWMVQKMQEFYPPGVCNLVCGDRDTGAALTAHPVPQMVSITGSTGAGIAVAAAPPRISSALTSNWAARRRSSSSTTPTSKPPSKAHRGRLFQRRPGLHGGDPDDHPRRYLRRLPVGHDRIGQQHQDRLRPSRRGRTVRIDQQREPDAHMSDLVDPAHPRTLESLPAASVRRAAGSSTNRR